jgi:hypothetical protein
MTATVPIPAPTPTPVLALPVSSAPKTDPDVHLTLCDAGRTVAKLYPGGHVSIPAGVTLHEAAQVWTRAFGFNAPAEPNFARELDSAEALQIAAAEMLQKPHMQPEARHLVALVQLAAEARRETRR